MSWFKSTFRSGLTAIFSATSSSGPVHGPELDEAAMMENIRDTMLALASRNAMQPPATLVRRIRYASDLQALWFMRGELMGLLAREYGEAAARQKVEELSAMFTDLLPPGLRSRPSPLSGIYRTDRFSDSN